MSPKQIDLLRQKLGAIHPKVEWKSTHISWIILCPDIVYKIPKPAHLPYLDFRSLEQRRLYCEREVQLNNRLTDGVYLGVAPIWQFDEQIGIEHPAPGATIIDYAVKMKRLPQDRLMRVMVENRQLRQHHIEALARQLAHFHQKNERTINPPDLELLQEDFADLQSVKSTLQLTLNEEAAGQVEEWVFDSRNFLRQYEGRMMERHQLGFYREVHGDLHAENIFLLEEPVVFDCIAFNEAFRHDDLLNELAFFCMDMDYHWQAPMGHLFLQQYMQHYPCLETEEDQQIFLYYKLYRANIRLKVNALKWEQCKNTEEQATYKQAIKDYFLLMRSYAKMLFRRTRVVAE